MNTAAIAILSATVCATPAHLGQDSAWVSRVDEYLSSYAEHSPTPGLSAVVVRGGEIVFAAGYGEEVLGTQRPMTARSSVGVGSLAKSFTALAVLQLVERGALSLDDPVVAHLPWFRSADVEVSDRITIRMLLSNTSGLPSGDATWFWDRDPSPLAMDRAARALRHVRTRRDPGTSWEYSNEGWSVLGRVIEQKSGLPYPDYLEQHLLTPLGMTRSSADPARFQELDALHGHYPGTTQPLPARPGYQGAAMAAGSTLHASAEDMGRYLIALLDSAAGESGLLTAASVREMWRPHVSYPGPSVEEGGTGDALRYGLGWMSDEFDGRRVVHHMGDTVTMSSETLIEPETGTAVTLLANVGLLDRYRWSPLLTVANNVLHIVNGRPLSRLGTPRCEDPSNNSFDLPSAHRARFAGTYLGTTGIRLRVAEVGTDLIATFVVGEFVASYMLDFSSPTNIVLRNIRGTMRGTMRTTPSGVVTGISVEGLVSDEFGRERPDLERYAAVRSPHLGVHFSLPRDYDVTWSGGQFIATHRAAPEVVVEGGRSVEDFEAMYLRLKATGTRLRQRQETLGGRVWRQAVWRERRDGRQRVHLLMHTSAASSSFFLHAHAPPSLVSGVVRDAIRPIATELWLESPVPPPSTAARISTPAPLSPSYDLVHSAP